jgi:hypothetical protein
MARFAAALDVELMVFLYAMAVAVLIQLLTHGINTSGLLNRKNGSRTISGTRVQLLISTIAASMFYLSELASNTTGKMPDINPGWLYGFGGSAGLYAVRKAWVNRSQLKRILEG